MTDELQSDLERIARDPDLSEPLKKQLIEASQARQLAENVQAFETSKHAAEHARGRWTTPFWVAVTGLITLTGNFAFDYWTARQNADLVSGQSTQDAREEQTLSEQNALATRQLQRDRFEAERAAQSLTFQYDVIKNELASLKTAEDRAASLQFLVRVGILAEPLKLEEIRKIIAEVEAGDENALPPVGGSSGSAYRHEFAPCVDSRVTDKITPQFIRRLRLAVYPSNDPLPPEAPAFIEALRDAFTTNGICAPDQVALLVSIVMWETAGFTIYEWSEEITRKYYQSSSVMKRLYPDEDSAVKYRPRGLAMITGIPNLERTAQELNRPDILSDPEIMSKDPQLAASILVALYRRTKILDYCEPNNCDTQRVVRRTIGVSTDKFQSLNREALRLLKESQ